MNLNYHLNEKLADGPVVRSSGFPDFGKFGECEERRLIARVDYAAGAHLKHQAVDQRTEHVHKVVPIFGGNGDLKLKLNFL